MPEPSPSPSKIESLKAAGTFNPRADHVTHPLFEGSEFFDPRDLPQLKYEALRALAHDGYSISRAAGEFGLSRPTIYQAQHQFEAAGLEGLLPHKRGPKSPHKLTSEVRQYLRQLATSHPRLTSRDMAEELYRRFGVEIHPRTVEKALKPGLKKGRRTST